MVSFPPPLKEPLPSNQQPDQQSDASVYRDQIPLTVYPPGSTIVLVSSGTHPRPLVPPTLPATDDDGYRIDRRDLSYTSYILSAWQRSVLHLSASQPSSIPDQPTFSFPTYNQVKVTTHTTTKNYIQYAHAGAQWRSSYFVKVTNHVPVLIIHLANDGLLYFDQDILDVDSVVVNKCHSKTTPIGWMVFKHGEARDGVNTKLSDFRTFAEAWFGTSDIQQSIMYNPTFWRLDICFQAKDIGVGLEFSFDRDLPIPDETDWWDE